MSSLDKVRSNSKAETVTDSKFNDSKQNFQAAMKARARRYLSQIECYNCHEMGHYARVCEAKSRTYQGVFEVKSRVKTWQVRGIWSQQFEH